MTIKKHILVTILLIVICTLVFSFTSCSADGVKKLFNDFYVTHTFDISDDFSNISIEVDTADIQFLISDDGNSHVIARDEKNINYDAFVEDGALKISVRDDRAWYEFINIGFEEASLSVYLPEKEYASLVINSSTGNINLSENFSFESIDIAISTGDLEVSASCTGAMSLETSTGDIDISNMSAGSISLNVSTGDVDVENVVCDGELSITVSTGDVELENLTCNNLHSDGSTGDLEMENVTVTDKISLTRSTGDIRLYDSDAAELDIETSTGSVKGVLLTSKIFIVQSGTGKIDVPETVEGGKCKIVTGTGDIKIEIVDNNS